MSPGETAFFSLQCHVLNLTPSSAVLLFFDISLILTKFCWLNDKHGFYFCRNANIGWHAIFGIFIEFN